MLLNAGDVLTQALTSLRPYTSSLECLLIDQNSIYAVFYELWKPVARLFVLFAPLITRLFVCLYVIASADRTDLQVEVLL